MKRMALLPKHGVLNLKVSATEKEAVAELQVSRQRERNYFQ